MKNRNAKKKEKKRFENIQKQWARRLGVKRQRGRVVVAVEFGN